jgi:non-heme chloroperoxidase
MKVVIALLLLSIGTASAGDRPLSLRFVNGGQDLPIAVAEWGNDQAPPVLLIHGANFSKEFWLLQRTPELDNCARFVALDLRGHGASGKPWRREDLHGTALWAADIHAALATFGDKKVLLVGWSLGGFVAMDYVRHFGTERLSGLLLIASPAGLLERTPGGTAPAGFVEALQQRASLDLRENAKAAAFIATASSNQTLTDEIRRSWVAQQMSVPVYLTQALRGRPLQNEDLLPRLNVPTAFLLGAEDASLSVAAFQSFVERKMPRATITIAPGAGHTVTHDAPNAFHESLDRLLSVSPATGAPRCAVRTQ